MWDFVIVVFIILALVLVLECAVLLYQYKKTDYYKQTGASFFKIRRDLGKLEDYYCHKGRRVCAADITLIPI